MHTHTAEVRVRYQETDQMGVVYYGNYYTWFEVGRNEFFRDIGKDCMLLEKQGIYMPVIESQCKYKHGARYDDEVVIQTTVEEITGAKIEFYYRLLRKTDKMILAEGKTIHGFVDKDFRPIRLKRIHPELWKMLNNCVKK